MGRFFAMVCLMAVTGCGESMDTTVAAVDEVILEVETEKADESMLSSMNDFRLTMIDKAETLAHEELSRLAAVELLYKNISQLQTEKIPVEERQVGGWVKSYRKYTGYEINDIYRSDSYLHPVVFEISYQFDQFHTPIRDFKDLKSQGISMKDKKFSLLKKASIIRRYRCDENGDYLGDLPQMPPRPSIFVAAYFSQERVVEEYEGVANPLPAR